MVGVGTAPLWLKRALYAAGAPSPRKKILVAIFQRGAADGLNVVVPHGEKAYYDLRPTIAIPRPAQGNAEAAIDLDGFFGLHPSLAPLKRLYQQQHLAIVHAAGSPDPTRSHFDAQDYMESGTPGRKATERRLDESRAAEDRRQTLAGARRLARSDALPRDGRTQSRDCACRPSAASASQDATAAKQFESMYVESRDPLIRAAGRDTFEAVAMLQSIQKRPYTSGRRRRVSAQLRSANPCGRSRN